MISLTRPLRWAYKNLFFSPTNTLLTIAICTIIFYIAKPLINWLILDANFVGNTADACNKSGACWVFIKVRFSQFIYGFYPDTETWRVNLGLVLGFINIILILVPKIKYKLQSLLFFIFVYPVIAYILFVGGVFGLPLVDTNLWGGLHLTLVIAVSGIVLSLPIGVILALGRRSKMPIIRAFCTIFIEIWRGVPLISVLFMASVMLPLFLPENVEFNKLVRALIGVALFSSAYMAEVIRGGLQAIPKGQFEAGIALGLGYWTRMRLVILPQAIKIVIPGIVNTFIGLFKDTTLVIIIGLFDLLGIVQAANTDPKWVAYNIEGYIFAAFGFWVFCYAMSKYSQYLEKVSNQKTY